MHYLLAIASIISGLACLSACANERAIVNDIDPDAPCQSAGDNPICALKTWFACEFSDSAIPCAAVGHEPFNLGNAGSFLDRQFEFDVKNRPWTLPLSFIFGYGPDFAYQPGFRLIGFRLVDPGRFRTAGAPVSEEFIGTHEVMFDWVDDATDDTWYAGSVFMRQVGQQWRVVSLGFWASGSGIVDMCGLIKGPRMDEPYCELYLSVEKWPDSFGSFGRDVGQNMPYRSRDEMVREPK